MDRDAGAAERLILALDTPTVADARTLVGRLDGAVSFYKIGLELALAGGLDLAGELIAAGRRVFLDLKFLDIGNTVERAVAQAADLGVTCLTVHGHDTKTLQAAVRGRGASQTRLLAVTVLTSLDGADLAEQGIRDGLTPGDLVTHRAGLAQARGFDGVIASGQEAGRLRAVVGGDFLIVTPGIRLADAESDDQVRVVTPERAIADGADYLVVGRPITAAADPAAAAERFIAAIGAGLAHRGLTSRAAS
ncbi:MAG: orotidine-5'-phosphate decarboxylase [Hyphomicrobiaceae bacterium]|nr:orotidine-5'-phosphate decarboxylase [Hyphomicrobiaceae bacterium]